MTICRAAATQKLRRHRIKSNTAYCDACGWTIGRLYKSKGITVHHVIPVSRGGSNYLDNLLVLCPNCHTIAHSLQGWGRHVIEEKYDKHQLLKEIKTVNRIGGDKYYQLLCDENTKILMSQIAKI